MVYIHHALVLPTLLMNHESICLYACLCVAIRVSCMLRDAYLVYEHTSPVTSTSSSSVIVSLCLRTQSLGLSHGVLLLHCCCMSIHLSRLSFCLSVFVHYGNSLAVYNVFLSFCISLSRILLRFVFARLHDGMSRLLCTMVCVSLLSLQ
eukprot:GILK01017785.1.p1 GENE.GILK01017785.1~~GILK01017785.1.p1  ORF type:complete len:149 (-),score=12.28 GILK01017785.1:55-501(-)